jgi:ribosomal protein L29
MDTAVWWNTCNSGGPCPPPDAAVPDSGLPPCSPQLAGSACPTLGDECDPQLGCGVHLRCSITDPTKQPGGCPVSRMRYKQDIRYLSQEELRATARDLLSLPLADFRYRDGDVRKHLGFMIDGHESLACVDGDRVDLYGYASMAVAAVQVQAAEIAELRAELASLRKELRKRRP